jgi:hypothetical protein
MPGCGSLVPMETNLLDAGLLPYEADAMSSSLWQGLALRHPTHQAKPVAGVRIATSGKSLWRGWTLSHPTLWAKACGEG